MRLVLLTKKALSEHRIPTGSLGVEHVACNVRLRFLFVRTNSGVQIEERNCTDKSGCATQTWPKRLFLDVSFCLTLANNRRI